MNDPSRTAGWGSDLPSSAVPIAPTTTITVNGRTYNSVEEMPPEVRRTYEELMGRLDRDGNGIPDVLEGGADPGGISSVSTATTRSWVIDGREYHSLNELPPHLRRMIGGERNLRGGISLHISWGSLIGLVVGLAIIAALLLLSWR